MQLLLFFPWRSNKDYVDAVTTVFALVFSLIALIIVFSVFHDYLASSLCHSMLSLPPLEPEESRPKVKRIGCLGDNGDCLSSSLASCTLWIRDFIIK